MSDDPIISVEQRQSVLDMLEQPFYDPEALLVEAMGWNEDQREEHHVGLAVAVALAIYLRLKDDGFDIPIESVLVRFNHAFKASLAMDPATLELVIVLEWLTQPADDISIPPPAPWAKAPSVAPWRANYYSETLHLAPSAVQKALCGQQMTTTEDDGRDGQRSLCEACVALIEGKGFVVEAEDGVFSGEQAS